MPQEWNELTRRIIGCAIRVHRELGPGVLENLYEEAMCVDLTEQNLRFARQQPVRMIYHGRPIGDLRIDLIVENLIVVELKAIERVNDAHRAQLLSYLRSTDLPLGLLINFNHPTLIEGVSRRINELSTLTQSLPLSCSLSSSEHSEFPLRDDTIGQEHPA